MPFRIDAVPAEATHDLRRQVLRGDRADSNVVFPEDLVDGAFHLAAFDDDVMVGVASFLPERTPFRPGAVAWRLRGMAVDESVQGRGAGTALLDEAVARLRGLGAEVVWANGRDTALRFYERHGWQVVGDGFVTGEVHLPHHVVVYDVPST
ncbi:MAG TPA: GNAT family N-acetyltransferase [Acidimicrobiales bacterium]|nr:GNAT family N-acetyltransferase [Acidimicrobiales bacterium]